ncbi:MAG: hypothetical protein II411_04390 [Lachnospiraceae bacterium]|nr:hypothetical protein [Lachnospiraceae bacterium]
MEELDFKTQLKGSLEALDKRIMQLEHLVNDVIIGSLESAANEYADNEAFDKFKGNYGESLKDLVGPYKKLFGEDYDLERSLYDDLKATEGYGTEGFDEAGCMTARIEDLKARIDAIKEDVKEVAEKVEGEAEEKAPEDGKVEVEVEEKPEGEDKEEEEISEEQLKKEFEDAMKEGNL